MGRKGGGADPRQQKLEVFQRADFTFNQRRAILRACVLPPLVTRHGSKVNRLTAMAILDRLYLHGDDRPSWPSLATLAAECQGISERTVRRAIEALEGIGVLCVERRRVRRGEARTVNHYTIVWTELSRLLPPEGCETNRTLATDQSDILGGTNRTLVSTKENRKETNKIVGNELVRLPDFSILNLANPHDVETAFLLLPDSCPVPRDRVFLAAAVAVRKGRNPAALFARLLRHGWGSFTPADRDHETAKRMQRRLTLADRTPVPEEM